MFVEPHVFVTFEGLLKLQSISRMVDT